MNFTFNALSIHSIYQYSPILSLSLMSFQGQNFIISHSFSNFLYICHIKSALNLYKFRFSYFTTNTVKLSSTAFNESVIYERKIVGSSETSFSVDQCCFSGCKSSNDDGGAIYNDIIGAVFVVTNSVFENCAGRDGGAIFYMCKTSSIKYTFFSNCCSVDYGNALLASQKPGETDWTRSEIDQVSCIACPMTDNEASSYFLFYFYGMDPIITNLNQTYCKCVNNAGCHMISGFYEIEFDRVNICNNSGSSMIYIGGDKSYGFNYINFIDNIINHGIGAALIDIPITGSPKVDELSIYNTVFIRNYATPSSDILYFALKNTKLKLQFSSVYTDLTEQDFKARLNGHDYEFLFPSTNLINSNTFFLTSMVCITPSAEFSYSQQFTMSLVFSNSGSFSSSHSFTFSNIFTDTSIFSHSNTFSESELFTMSKEFTLSSVFTESIEFTISHEFSNSEPFTASSVFSQSSFFSPSVTFTPPPTLSFSQTDSFTPTDRFSSSKEFSHSHCFSFSLSFSKSTDKNYNIASDPFTPSSVFTPSNFFTPAQTKVPDPYYKAEISGNNGFTKEELIKAAVPASFSFVIIIVSIVFSVYYIKKKLNQINDNDPPNFDISTEETPSEYSSSYSYYTFDSSIEESTPESASYSEFCISQDEYDLNYVINELSRELQF
ncbi:hypothetical protein TRFO_34955 [Tritrichomonas foetus]|uniref:Uncharacterized protein n=1 Tax=Tritrichomonas foetus TaxID=1144522 RepID=A0A1J4JHJ6_9EUKA|nr:hypothetical protein TRFO_34955 [Tritrichomonas foetus]|eukprot:OHS98624.1 hypothetical protein TRFO_34955 [Tritrichomonas foetus]